MENRRNFYRILQVQPDAPEAVIKASYRTLMQKLKMHPDLGGDHWNASVLNEAYKVLIDPEARQRYDETLMSDLIRRGAPPAAEKLDNPRVAREHCFCVFCKSVNWSLPEPHQSLCWECASPLTRDLEHRKQGSKRMIGRVNSRIPVTYYTNWPQAGIQGVVTNISPLGFCLESQHELLKNYVVKVDSDFFNAICRVTRCTLISHSQLPYELGLETLAIVFENKPGRLLSITI